MHAPGGPGAAAAWGPGRKQAFGAAPGVLSKVWFTLAGGSLSEVFHPRIDQPALNRLRFLVAAPGSPPVEDASEADHTVSWIRPGVPAFSVCSSHHEYHLDKDFVIDPELNALVVSGSFRPDLPDLRLYVQAEAHLDPQSPGNDAFVLDSEPPVLVMRRGDVWIALVGPFARGSAGFLNSSDLFVDLHDGDGEMSYGFSQATGGNAVVGAEMGQRSGSFQLAIGFGHSRADAEEVARQVLQKGAGAVRASFERAWFSEPDLPQQLARVSPDGGTLARCSLTVLRCLEDKSERGAFVAAPCAPWGESQHSGDHVYHLVWPRDLFHIASALIDLGDRDAGLRALRYLGRIQKPDGSWPQNCTVDGRQRWEGIELDQVALPILLAWRLGVNGWLDHDPYSTMVRRAAAFLIGNGPSTPLDRWEDAGGFSPSTIAVSVSALCVAAEFADDAGDHVAAAHMRSVADYWADRVEAWTYSRRQQYYLRLTDDPGRGAEREHYIGVEFLELVRRGVRAADDPYVMESLRWVDAFLKVETPAGPGWRRYWGDAYGEREGGADWEAGAAGTGKGRPWPLLTGERAFHALALGEQVSTYVETLEKFAGPSMMLPEQVWDLDEVPARGLRPGGATGSASPLGWAHAEYLKLLAAVAGATIQDVVQPARRRYVEDHPLEPAFIWSDAHQIGQFLAGRRVKIQLRRPGTVRWTGDEWHSHREVSTHDTTLGFWVAELPTQIMRPGAVMEWTAHYEDGWEGQNHALTCVGEGG